MKLLFIDANIFLKFYDFSDEDLVELQKLVDLIKQKKEIKLFLTKQVCNEIKKNREHRLKKSYGQFLGSVSSISMPVFCRHYEEYSDILRVQKILGNIKKILSNKIWGDIQNKRLKADKVVQDLINASYVIDSDKYLEKAIKRYQSGLPPGKKAKSYGDEINWESLLAEVGDEGEFIIISQDGDYSSALDENQLKDFLIDEWASKSKNKKEVFLYENLTKFFKEHDIKIELLIEKEKGELIENFKNSPSFASTHEIIRGLNQYASFSNDQIRKLGEALENTQVGGIIEDADVNKFYQEHLIGKDDLFEPDTWIKIRKLIWGMKGKQEIESKIQEIERKYKETQEEEIDIKNIPF